MAREKTLTKDHERIIRELFSKGQTREQLAVGFGVSYNTIRGILGSSDLETSPQPVTDGKGTS
jgi:DNA-binding CsgD family transcriptional regulator